jgi:hypothetical protein
VCKSLHAKIGAKLQCQANRATVVLYSSSRTTSSPDRPSATPAAQPTLLLPGRSTGSPPDKAARRDACVDGNCAFERHSGKRAAADCASRCEVFDIAMIHGFSPNCVCEARNRALRRPGLVLVPHGLNRRVQTVTGDRPASLWRIKQEREKARDNALQTLAGQCGTRQRRRPRSGSEIWQMPSERLRGSSRASATTQSPRISAAPACQQQVPLTPPSRRESDQYLACAVDPIRAPEK